MLYPCATFCALRYTEVWQKQTFWHTFSTVCWETSKGSLLLAHHVPIVRIYGENCANLMRCNLEMWMLASVLNYYWWRKWDLLTYLLTYLFQGQEYVEQYKLEYQREDDGRWFTFRTRRNQDVSILYCSCSITFLIIFAWTSQALSLLRLPRFFSRIMTKIGTQWKLI